MKIIDLNQWPRREVFELYRDLEFPYVGLCADIDVTNLLAYCQQHQLSSYRAVSYALMRCTEQFAWLRQRIDGDNVVEHDRIGLGVVSLSDDQQLRFGRLPPCTDWSEFNQACHHEQQRVKQTQSLLSDEANTTAVIYTSCLPWLRFTQFTHPVPLKPSCSIPRFGWGKYDRQGERTVMPFSVQVHHGLADGLDIAKLIQRLTKLFEKPESWLTASA